MYMKCYKDSIRVISQSADDEKECPREVGDFNAVRNFSKIKFFAIIKLYLSLRYTGYTRLDTAPNIKELARKA